MKKFNDVIIIGVDHGYGNIKTANHCFRTGITAYDSEPLSQRICLFTVGSSILSVKDTRSSFPTKSKTRTIMPSHLWLLQRS